MTGFGRARPKPQPKMWSHFTSNLLREIDWALSAHQFIVGSIFIFVCFFFRFDELPNDVFFSPHSIFAIPEPRLTTHLSICIRVPVLKDTLFFFYSNLPPFVSWRGKLFCLTITTRSKVRVIRQWLINRTTNMWNYSWNQYTELSSPLIISNFDD